MLGEREVVARVRGLTVARLRRWVREGWVAAEREGGDVRFSEIDLARVRLICELCDEIRVNREAMPIILSLLDQVYGLRQELRSLAQAVEDMPRSVRVEMVQSFRTRRPG
jgi:chaperone modulatory protein CbpM